MIAGDEADSTSLLERRPSSLSERANGKRRPSEDSEMLRDCLVRDCLEPFDGVVGGDGEAESVCRIAATMSLEGVDEKGDLILRPLERFE